MAWFAGWVYTFVCQIYCRAFHHPTAAHVDGIRVKEYHPRLFVSFVSLFFYFIVRTRNMLRKKKKKNPKSNLTDRC